MGAHPGSVRHETPSAAASARRRPSVAVRRTGYLAAVVANLVVLYLVNGWPGWDAVPFLTDETTEVLPYVNLSIVATTVANLVYAVRDTAVVKAGGDLVTTLISLVVLVRIWQVLPFDFSGVWDGWKPVTYTALVLGTVGVSIAVVVQLVTLAREATRRLHSHQW